MRKILLTLVFCLTNLVVAISQISSLEYSYDLSGNRIARRTVYLNKQSVESNMNPNVDSTSVNATIDDNYSGGDDENTLADNLNGYLIKVYPNPTEGKLVVQLSGYETVEAEISVYDFQNKLLFSRRCEKEYTDIDLSAYENGVYLMYIRAEGKLSSWKVVKD